MTVEALLDAKLAALGIAASPIVSWRVGPVLTRYDVVLRPDVKLARLAGVEQDLALAVGAVAVRVIRDRGTLGIEVPHEDRQTVTLGPLLTHKPAGLTFALGRDVVGEPVFADLAAMPHLLIAGATGSGKSVCVNALVTQLIGRTRFVLVDMKRVEFAAYEHLRDLALPVVTEPDAALAALRWTVAEMERRYVALLAAGSRSGGEPLVIVIDEMADLIIRDKRTEPLIVRLAQKARAVGIHLVLATQRPTVNVVTGLIKANVSARIAFAVSSQVDSRVILDTFGAEDLIGKGDMLFLAPDSLRPVRLQGVYVSDAEIDAAVRGRMQGAWGFTSETIHEPLRQAWRLDRNDFRGEGIEMWPKIVRAVGWDQYTRRAA
jgi:S-DNA-T family DNA segregation ATPase FtsK/SpoIIIE